MADKRPPAGPPQLLHLLRRIREESRRFFGVESDKLDLEPEASPEREPSLHRPDPDIPLTDADRARLLGALCGFIVLPTLWFGPRLDYPFNAVSILIASLFGLIMASAAHFFPNRGLVVVLSLVSGALMLIGVAMLLRLYPPV